jgi:hypothetical protein
VATLPPTVSFEPPLGDPALPLVIPLLLLL